MRPFVALALVLLAGPVHADPRVATAEDQTDESTLHVQAPIDVPAGPPVLDMAQARDAANDRAFGLGTALVQPVGNVDMSLRSALEYGAIASLAAGLGHGIELSVDGARIGGSTQSLVGVGVKIQLVRRRTYAIAVDASVHQMTTDSGETSFDTDYLTTGVKLTTCAGATCRALVTFGLGVAASRESITGGGPFDAIAPLVSGSVIAGTGAIRPMLELVYIDALYGFAGARFGGRHAALDVGVGFTSSGSDPTSAMMLGLSVRP